ncbi:MarR family winged helix-turn-helix transcriptional regulator [Streptomyces sp. NPDC059564]|uniref:MarR family winged helix-turn-helix transcriptional regulator n=1 Tax=Streptomyces sp. NPDC059564 TaxID=3346865 RepID=UPI0036B126E8
MTTPSRLKPIGYYLKHLDALLDQEFDRALGESGLGRRHWQVLHVLVTDGPHDSATLTARLRPFWDQDAISLYEVTSDLTSRGWITHEAEAGTYAATPAGERGHTEAERVVTATRSRVTAGVTDAEYAATVTTLARMCDNLGSVG